MTRLPEHVEEYLRATTPKREAQISLECAAVLTVAFFLGIGVACFVVYLGGAR